MTLASPAAAIGYYLWLRTRWPLAGSLAGMLAIWFIAGFVPQEMRPSLLPPSILIFSTLLVILMSVFTFAGGDLSARESGFPRYMLILPVSARKLATLPMIYGGLISALMWVLLIKIGLARIGPGAPVLWPATASAAVCVWLQVISWTPVWFKMARVFAGVVILTGVIAVGLCGQMLEMSSLLLLAAYLAMIAAAFPMAIAGLARARRGDGTVAPWNFSKSSGASAIYRPLRPFSSPWRAILWLECRRNITFSIGLCTLMPLAIVIVMQLTDPNRSGIYVHDFLIHPAVLGMSVCLAMPLFAATFMNATVAKPDAWRPNLELPAFHATRPLSTTYMLRMKLITAAIVVIATWGITLLIVGVWIFLPHSFDARHTMAQIIRSKFTLGHMCVAIVLLAVIIFLSWKVIAESLFVYFYGRKWLMNTVAIACLGIWGSVPAVAYWFSLHPRLFGMFMHFFPWLAAAIVIIRLAAWVHILRLLDRHRLVSMPRSFAFAAAWLLLAAGIWSALFASFHLMRSHAWGLALGVFFLLPAVRLSLAPLMLHLNRHR